VNHRWLFRMKRWVQNPPSENRVKFILAILAICLLVVALERLFGVPDWMQMSPRGLQWRPD